MTVATLPLGLEVFEAAYAHVAPHIHHTPLLTSRMLSERDRLRRPAQGRDVPAHRVVQDPRAAEQVRARSPRSERRRGVVCSSAGNHAQGVALAAQIHGIRAVVVHGGERDAVEGRGDARLRRRGRAARHDLGRGQREGEGARARPRAHLHPPVRRLAAHRRAGHARPRDRAGLARRRRGRRADRRRRADLRRVDGGQEPSTRRSESSASSRPARPACTTACAPGTS